MGSSFHISILHVHYFYSLSLVFFVSFSSSDTRLASSIALSQVHIRNLTVNSPCCAGICIGSEMSGGVENIFVEDIVLQNVGQGLRLKAGLGRGGFIRDVKFKNVQIKNAINWGIQVNDYYGSHNKACHGRDKNAAPNVTGITFENVVAYGVGNGANFEGLHNAPVMNILLKNVTLKTTGDVIYQCNVTDGRFDDNCQPTPICSNLTPLSFLDEH